MLTTGSEKSVKKLGHIYWHVCHLAYAIEKIVNAAQPIGVYKKEKPKR